MSDNKKVVIQNLIDTNALDESFYLSRHKVAIKKELDLNLKI